uniref:Uncharacterized protein n=1 Tax=Octopus bimaculoides TaxID=37653 RepID=A0A0L8GYL7_OCTBM
MRVSYKSTCPLIAFYFIRDHQDGQRVRSPL